MPRRSPPPNTAPAWGSPAEIRNTTGARSCGNQKCSQALYGTSDNTRGDGDGAAGATGARAPPGARAALGEIVADGEAIAAPAATVGASAAAGSATSSSVHPQPSRLRNRIVPAALRA